MTKIEINRIKVALAETRIKDKRLAEQLDKDESTISQWCSNSVQPSIEKFHKIAIAFEIDIRELLNQPKSINE